MSINSAMLAGVTGLTANASALAATSDNIANVNTVGYKRAQTNFSDLVTAASTQDYSAGGVTTSIDDSQYVTQQGLLQSRRARPPTWPSPARASSSLPRARPTSRPLRRACSPAPAPSRWTARAS